MSATTAVEMPEIGATGLTPKEVVQRIESGQSNAVKTSTSRSVQDIVRANVFTLFNGIIFAAMVLVLITGSPEGRGVRFRHHHQHGHRHRHRTQGQAHAGQAFHPCGLRIPRAS